MAKSHKDLAMVVTENFRLILSELMRPTNCAVFVLTAMEGFWGMEVTYPNVITYDCKVTENPRKEDVQISCIILNPKKKQRCILPHDNVNFGIKFRKGDHDGCKIAITWNANSEQYPMNLNCRTLQDGSKDMFFPRTCQMLQVPS
eukprot:TRINITY_DN2269_c0_g1_i1.p1 TRINITY_DN2269_c0_g1~~TRINITY_DN2269_c0_g1_i1.p1  ORF type:complete len:158 (+),score=21.93 TRINITY_DN2269_c0_g1_i1:42-476(+)